VWKVQQVEVWQEESPQENSVKGEVKGAKEGAGHQSSCRSTFSDVKGRWSFWSQTVDRSWRGPGWPDHHGEQRRRGLEEHHRQHCARGGASTARCPAETIEEIIRRADFEKGDSGDSDVEGEGFKIMNDFGTAIRDVADHQLMNDYDKIEMNVDGVPDNHTMSYVSTNKSVSSVISGAPDGWYPSAAPEGWKPRRLREAHNEPGVEDLDNLVKLDRYMFQPKFNGVRGTGQYSHHSMPAGAQVLPKDAVTDKRTP
jgi:hypothetical protein